PARWKDKFRVVAKECLKIPKVGDLGEPWTWRTLVIASLWVGISVRFLSFLRGTDVSCAGRQIAHRPELAKNELTLLKYAIRLLFNMRTMHLEVKEDQRFKGAGPLCSFCCLDVDRSPVPLPYFTDLAEGPFDIVAALRAGPTTKRELFDIPSRPAGAAQAGALRHSVRSGSLRASLCTGAFVRNLRTESSYGIFVRNLRTESSYGVFVRSLRPEPSHGAFARSLRAEPSRKGFARLARRAFLLGALSPPSNRSPQLSRSQQLVVCQAALVQRARRKRRIRLKR